MGFINAIKITFSRISLIFKVLLYDIVIASIMIAICAGILLPQFSEVGQELGNLAIGEKFVENIQLWLHGEIVLSQAIANLYTLLEQMLAIVGTKLLSLTFFTIIGATLIAKFLLGLRVIPTYDIVNSHMTESSNYYFLGNLTRNLGRSTKFSLVNMLITIPCDFAILTVIYFAFGLFIRWVGLLALPLMVVLIVVLFAFRNTVFYFWLPLVLQGKPIFKAFGSGVKLAFKHFSEIFFAQITYVTLVIVLCMLVVSTTFGAGLLIVCPLCCVILSAMKLGKYYDVKKMPYYVTNDNVITPSIVEDIEVNDTEADYEEEVKDTEN